MSSGYLQLASSGAGMPVWGCVNGIHLGRMKVDRLWICMFKNGSLGWQGFYAP